jgi:hypothetical protein
MPLVFVHGVNVRRDPADPEPYDREERDRTARLKTAFIGRPGVRNVHVLNPYWGDLGVTFAAGLSTIPVEGQRQFLGGEGDEAAQVLAVLPEGAVEVWTRNPPSAAPLAALARECSLEDAIDTLLAFSSTAAESSEAAAVMAAFGSKAVAYAAAHRSQSLPWLRLTSDDDQFLRDLYDAVQDWEPPGGSGDASIHTPPEEESLGVGDAWRGLRKALAGAQRGLHRVLMDRGGDLLRPLVLRRRHAATSLLGRFFGDIFVYFDLRGDHDHPGEIPRRITESLRRASELRTAEDPELYIVAHSMGGNIVYDVITHFAPEIQCDLLVTVGSQVALFEEMKRYRASRPGSAGTTVLPRPKNVRRWVNIYDLSDILAFSTSPVFDESIRNYQYDGRTLPLLSHTAYFQRQTFFDRLQVRIEEAFAADN